MLKKGMYVIFGYCDFGECIFDFLSENGINNIIFCDNNNKKIDSESVFSVRDATKNNPNAFYVLATFCRGKSMRKQLLDYGIPDEHIIDELPKSLIEKGHKIEQKRRLQNLKTIRFEINVVKHCNLNCKGCDHFAPLYANSCMNLQTIQDDFLRMWELFGDRISEIHILGGEPLLHPDIAKIILLAREIFPCAHLCLDSNGILLRKMPEHFWAACLKSNIECCLTNYPIKIDYPRLIEWVKNKGVSCSYLGMDEYGGHSLWKYPLSAEGIFDVEKNFIKCGNAMRCVTLECGKLYPCSIAPNARAFLDKFAYKFSLAKKCLANDGVDLYSAKSSEDVINKLLKPLSFCRFCDVENRSYDHPFELSKRDISEWTLTEK